MESIGDKQDAVLCRVQTKLRQLIPGIQQILYRVVGLVLLHDALRRDSMLHQIVIHGLGLAGRLIRPLAAGDHHWQVRVLLQVLQGRIQPVLKQNGRPPGLDLAAQNHHGLGLSHDLTARIHSNHRTQRAEEEDTQNHQRQQNPPKDGMASALVGLIASGLHARASSRAWDSRSHSA